MLELNDQLKNKSNSPHFETDFKNAKLISMKGTAFNIEELQIKKTCPHAFIAGLAYLHSDYTNDCISLF